MSYDPIALGIHWDRLISIADEIIQTLVRSAFSTNVKESYDLSCVLFDARGNSLVQGTYSSPGFTGTAPATLAHMLECFPSEKLEPGDLVMTNDPWMGTGHLFDVSVMQPVFRHGALVGYVMSITHLPDIGGAGFSATAREVYEEGLNLPVCKLARAGEFDPFILGLVRANVRVADQTIGDLMANATCTAVGARMLVEFMDEYAIDSLKPLADAIFGFSEKAIRAELAHIPDGLYTNRIQVEGFTEPVALACAIRVDGSDVHIDFAGTDEAVPAAINVPMCYTRAMAWYSIKTLTTPKIPNNQGSLAPVRIDAPDNCILNALAPFPTGGRHIIGHFVTPLIFGALAEVLPDRVQADSGMLMLMNVQGKTREGRGVSSILFASGGSGAFKGIDGASCTPSPSNITGTPVEVWENLTGGVIEDKSFLVDSGGAGQFRGGLGQRIHLRNDSGHPMSVACLASRTKFAPAGLNGGKPGRLREIQVNGRRVHSMGRYILAPGEAITTLEAGGGGYGDPTRRDPALIAADVAAGLVSSQSASRDYGWQPDEEEPEAD